MKIRGATVATPMPRPDWNQTNPNKADYIRNKPVLLPAITCEASGTELTLTDSDKQPLVALTLDTTGLTSGEAVGLEVSGKNLFNFDSVVPTIKGEGSTLNMTAAGYQYDIFTGSTGSNHKVAAENINKLPALPAGTYTISYTRLTDAGYMRVFKVAADGTVSAITSGTTTDSAPLWKFQFTLDAPSKITIRRSVNTAATVENLQIERGEVATSYEQYNTPQEVTVEATGGKVNVLEQHPGLMSYKPTTIIRTPEDGDLNMDVEYVADTKTYIDNKFAELATALAMN